MNQLYQVVSFVGVGAGLQATLPHTINVNGVALIPDIVFPDTAGFTINTVTSTQVTVTNGNGVPGNCNVLLCSWHSILRAFGVMGVNALAPQPFIPAFGGAGGGGSGNRQAFVYTALGTETSTFTMNLPAARANTNYIAIAHDGGRVDGALASFTCPQSAYALGTIQVKCSVAPAVGDKILVFIQDRTS